MKLKMFLKIEVLNSLNEEIKEMCRKGEKNCQDFSEKDYLK